MAWLKRSRCKPVVMESNGVYWAAIRRAGGGFDVWLANAQRTRKVAGRKTDRSDSEWLAYLPKGGLIRRAMSPTVGFEL